MKYITFDPYYSKSKFNSFLMSAFNNSVELKVMCSIRPPYYFYLQVNDSDVPRFLNYEELKTSDLKYLNNILIPRYPNEEFILRRKDNDGKMSFERFISNDVLLQAKTEKFVMFFKFQGNKLKDYSRNLPNTKFYLLGTKAGYKIGVCFNPLARVVVDPTEIIFIEETGDYRNPGELESRFNYSWKPNLKLENKTFESSYYLNGTINLINKPVITLS